MALSLANFSGGGSQNGPFTTVTSSAQSVASGNSLVVGLRWGASQITDNAGNTYTKLPFVAWPGSRGTTGDGAQFFLCNNCVGKSNLQVTGTLTSGSTDTFTVIGVWQFSGGTLIPDQILSTQSGVASTTQSFIANPHYQQSVVCLLDGVDSLSTYGINSPLTLDGGTSVNGQSIFGASHAIFNTGFSSQTLSMTSSVSDIWFMPGVIFRIVPPGQQAGIDPNSRRRIQEAALFTGREFDYFITLEKVWSLS